MVSANESDSSLNTRTPPTSKNPTPVMLQKNGGKMISQNLSNKTQLSICLTSKMETDTLLKVTLASSILSISPGKKNSWGETLKKLWPSPLLKESSYSYKTNTSGFSTALRTEMNMISSSLNTLISTEKNLPN